MNKKIVFTKESELPEVAVTQGSMLFNKTASWRNIKPVINYEKCSKCMVCWKFCPEISIIIENGVPMVNYEYCKGCGICSVECPRGAIEMEVEEK